VSWTFPWVAFGDRFHKVGNIAVYQFSTSAEKGAKMSFAFADALVLALKHQENSDRF